MERKAVSGIMLTLLLTSMLTLAFNIRLIEAEPTTWTVDDDGPADFSTIQEAINAASPGDTVYVHNGTYYENVVVNKTVSLIGENRRDTIIDGKSTGNVVEVTASNVTITGFTIQESGTVHRNYGIYIGESSSGNKLSYNIIKNNYDGICLLESSSNSLSRNNITANNHDSIYLYSSSSNIIFENNITNNNFGIRLFEWSNHNSITRNKITHNDYGIDLTESSSDNNVSRNNITNNNFSIHLSYFSNYNNILENNIANNSYGVWLYGSANNNSIHGNNITAHIMNGIWLAHSSNNSVSGNNIANNGRGIQLSDSSNNSISENNIANNDWGIDLFDNSNGNSVSANNVTANHWEGITVIKYSNHNNISGNNIANNGYGIHLDYYSSNNSISANKITANHGIWQDGYGIKLTDWSSNNSIYGNTVANNVFGIWLLESSNNTIYHDDFINNTQQVYDESIKYSWASPSINTWDNDYPSGGNYWSDYEERYPDAKELNGSSIWNTPYVIDENNQDRYPLMSPYVPDLTPPTTIDDYDDLWHSTDFTVTLTATDDVSGVAETYYKINDGPTKTVNADGQPLITTEGANNTLEYWSIDNADNEELPHKILAEIKLDETAPTGSITINNGDAYTASTSVTLTLTATDAVSGVAEMCFSNDNTIYTDWEPYASSKSWNLQDGDGTKTVYIQYLDNAGLVSSTYQDTITVLLDTDGDGTPDTTDTDDDNDGMPDTWETENGLNPLDAADASLDPDGDGLTNLQEYQGDTDPNVSDAEGVPFWILGAIAAVVIGIAAATAAFLLRRRK